MPTFWGYIRVSTRDQADGGVSLDAQREELRRLYELRYSKTHAWGRVAEDRAVSGGKKFLDRPEASKLQAGLDRGDVVAVTKLDRGFRNTLDCLQTVEVWTGMGVSLRMAFMDLDTGTAFGRAMLTVMAMGAELEREYIRERTNAAFAHLRSIGCKVGGPVPYGFDVQLERVPGRSKPRRKLVKSERQRAVGRLIVELRTKGMSWQQIARELEARRVRLRPKLRTNWGSCRKAFLAEIALQAKERAAQVALSDDEELVELVTAPGEGGGQ